MLGVLCARPKPWLLGSLSFSLGSSAHPRLLVSPIESLVVAREDRCRRLHSSRCCVPRLTAASVWHAILPAAGNLRGADLSFRRKVFHHCRNGEGSWNVAWDSRPARWLHWPDSAWLLFGVCACACLALPPQELTDSVPSDCDSAVAGPNPEVITSDVLRDRFPDYRVTGVLPDGRCLFRAIAHVACLRNGEEAPDENRQRELADELRAQVVDELLRRRKEAEWFIEGDFDAYVKSIQQPFVWGGEPELLMASHVVRTPISVFMIDRDSGDLINIANYGEEYLKDGVNNINVLFHGYGHYDILESISDQSHKKVEG